VKTREEVLSQVRSSGFDSLLADFPDPVAVYDLDGTFLVGNAALRERGGYSRSELDVLTLDDFLRPEDSPLVSREFAEASRGETRRFDMAGVSPTGVAYRAQVTLLPVFDDTISIAVIAIVHDLAVLDEVWTSGTAVEQFFGDDFGTMSEGLVLVRHDWLVLFITPRAEAMLSATHETEPSHLLWERIPWSQGTEFAIAARAAMTSRESSVIRDYDTALGLWREARFHPTVEGLAIYVRDVTAEQELLERAAAVEAQVAAQAALLDIAHDAIYVRNLDNVVTYWNQGATDIFGWTAEEMVGTNVRQYIKHDVDVWDSATADALRDGQWSGQLTKEARDGRVVVLDCRWTIVSDEFGKPQSILAVNTDITVRKKQEEQLLRSQRMDSLGTLASGIAHDLNNVLTPILLSTQLLLAGEKDKSRRELLTTIESGTTRGAEMLAQILTFGRGVDGRRAPVDISGLLTGVERFSRDTVPGSIHVSLDVSANLWEVIGDETQLFQVLVNLVINARDAMPSGGELTMSARNLKVGKLGYSAKDLAPGQYVVIEIEDTGTGMTAETISKVFEPFFTTKAVGEGTGLGLSTSMEIIRGHGGWLQVYSEPGHGSRFTLHLPVDSGTVNPVPVTAKGFPRPVEAPRGHGEVVLVVDDEAAIRMTTRRALEMYGYSPAVASNGIEALEYLESVGGCR
jgi:two-component system cell cycle sensor histidine kinase/response regulator CckA